MTPIQPSKTWALRYLFYRFYRWQVSCWKDDDVSFNAFLLVVVFIFLNLVTLLGLAESVVGRPFVIGAVPQKIGDVGIVIIGEGLLALPLYFVFLRKGKYKHIVSEFESESPRQRTIRGIAVLLYVVFSLVFLFAGALLHGRISNQ